MGSSEVSILLAYCSASGLFDRHILKYLKPRKRRKPGKSRKKFSRSFQIGFVLGHSFLRSLFTCTEHKGHPEMKASDFFYFFWACVLPWAYRCLSRFPSIHGNFSECIPLKNLTLQLFLLYFFCVYCFPNCYFLPQTALACSLSFSVLGDVLHVATQPW